VVPDTSANVTHASRRHDNFILGILCSFIFHGLVLLALLWIPHVPTKPPTGPHVIPINVVELAQQTVGIPQRNKAPVPQEKAAAPALSPPRPVGVSPSAKPPPPDELEAKLRALAKLQEPSLQVERAERETGTSNTSATSSDAAPGSYAAYAVRDYIRAQVERRWSMDASTLGTSDFSVLVRVEITSTGVVTSAAILDTARFNADKAYREVALSARNAVLLSSPFNLPPGNYKNVMDMTLRLNPRDVLR